jgi:hypothetical protein
MWLIFESWNILASCILQTLILPSVPKAQYRSLNTLVLKIWWTCMISSSTLSSILSIWSFQTPFHYVIWVLYHICGTMSNF